MPGNTSDKTTLRAFLEKMEQQSGKAQRVWVMDRGIPTEEVLAEMRAADPPICYPNSPVAAKSLAETPAGCREMFDETR